MLSGELEIESGDQCIREQTNRKPIQTMLEMIDCKDFEIQRRQIKQYIHALAAAKEVARTLRAWPSVVP